MVYTKKVICGPTGSSIYDKDTGITIRLNHDESRMFLEDYEQAVDFECPEVVHAEVTTRCNLDCGYCYVPKEAKELGFDEWMTIIKDLSDFGIFQLTFGGGEPFLRDDACKLARFADDSGVNTTVTTNGMLLHRFSVDELKVFRQINISYHESALAHGFRLEKALERLEKANVHAGINLVLSKNYISHLTYVSKIAKKHNALLLLLSYKPITGDHENVIDLGTIREHVHSLADEGLEIGIDSLICGDCEQVEKLCTISSAGEVYPCSFVRQSMGNIVKQPIEAIWKSRDKETECPYMSNIT